MAYKRIHFELNTPTKVNFFLVEQLNLPAKLVSRMMDKGWVLINGERITAKGAHFTGTLEVMYHEPTPIGLRPIFETEHFAIFDKPSGLLVHQNGFDVTESLIDDIKHLYGAQANLVHRLDRETSGLVLASKDKTSERELKHLFQMRGVEKHYLAFIRGKITAPRLIDAAILTGMNHDRLPSDPTPRVLSAIHPAGQAARTKIIPLRYLSTMDATLLQCQPLTGRTHQIRLHLAHIGHPIFGDPFYGVSVEIANEYLDKTMTEARRIEATGAKRLMLQAASLKFSYKQQSYWQESQLPFDEPYLQAQLSSNDAGSK